MYPRSPGINMELTQSMPYNRQYNFDCPAFPVFFMYAVFSMATSPCGALSKLEARKPFTCANIYTVQAYTAGAYPFSTNFTFRSTRDSSNINLATAIPLPEQQLQFGPLINQLYLELHTNFSFFSLAGHG